VQTVYSVFKLAVIPAQAGIQFIYLIDLKDSLPCQLDSRLRGNDGFFRAAAIFYCF
jgi:hypothetical protein